MTRIYGALLNLTTPGRPEVPASLDDVAGIALEWAGVGNARGAAEGDFPARNGGDVRAQRFELSETGDAAWRMAFQHVSNEERGVIWRTAISVVEAAETRAVVELGRFVEDGVSRPWSGVVDPPRLVRNLIDSTGIDVVDGGVGCGAGFSEADVVRADDVGRLLQLAYHPRRRLPLVLFTEGRTGGRIDLDRLQRRLAGVAHIRQLDPSATWELSQQAPRGATPWDGWTRLWWPGFSPSSHKAEAPWWKPEAPAEEVVLGIERLAISSATQSFSVLPEFKAIQAEVRNRRAHAVVARQAEQAIELGAWRGRAEDQSSAAMSGLQEAQQRIGLLETENAGLRELMATSLEELKHEHEEDMQELVSEHDAMAEQLTAKTARIEELEQALAAFEDKQEAESKLKAQAERFREDMNLYYAREWTEDDRVRHPLGQFEFHSEFFDSVSTVAYGIYDRVIRLCVAAAANRTEMLRGHEAAAAAEDKPTRSSDNAVAMRVYLEEKTPNARRLLYWRRPDGRGLEFVRCAGHDDYAMAEEADELL
jgi:hypothetical protein